MYDYVIFSDVDFEEPLKRGRHYFAEFLSKKRKVLFVNPLIERRGFWDIFLGRKKEFAHRVLLQQNSEKYFTLTFQLPLILRFYKKPIVKATNFLRWFMLGRIFKALDFDNIIYVTTNPQSCPLDLKLLKNKKAKIFYYVYDYYAGYIYSDKNALKNAEENLILVVDTIFVVSEKLRKAYKEKYDKKVFILSNGVDYDYFDSILREKNPKHPLSSIKSPRVGYLGVINNRFDTELISYLAQKRRDLSFVIIGPKNINDPESSRQFDFLVQQDNVHWIGPISSGEVPYYLQDFDVAFMNHKELPWVDYRYPLKVNEYLAMGKPVISYPIDCLSEFEDNILIAKTQEEWLFALDTALKDDSAEKKLKRREIAKKNSWDNRIESFLKIAEQENRLINAQERTCVGIKELRIFIFKQKCIPWRVSHWIAMHMPATYSVLTKGNPNTRRYWDAKWTHDGGSEQVAYLENVYKEIIDIAPERSRVLDIGCGIGELLMRLREAKQCDVHGLDISKKAIDELAKRGISGKVAALPRIPYPQEHFDMIIATEVLEHLYAIKRTLKSMERVLKPGGKIVISVPNNALHPDAEYEHVRYFTKDSLQKLLSARFEDIAIRTIKVVGTAGEFLLTTGIKSGRRPK